MNPEFTDTFILDTQKNITNHEIRITTLEETVKDIKALTQATSELAFNQKSMNEKIDANQKSMNDKIDANQESMTEKIDELTTSVQAIVDEPKKNWITIRTAILSSVGGAIGTGIIAWLITFLK